MYAIDVKRSDVQHTEVRDLPWSSQWNDAINAIKTGDRSRPDTDRRVEMDVVGPVRPEVHEIDLREKHEHLDEIRSRLDKLMPMLSDAKTRYEWERHNSGSVIKRINRMN